MAITNEEFEQICERVLDVLDVESDPDVLSTSEAIEFFEVVESHCHSMIVGLRHNLEDNT